MFDQLPLATLTSSWVLAVILIVVFFGAIVQFGLGMGFGLTVAPLLAIVDPALVPAPTLFMGLMTALIGAVRERHEIVWQEVGTGISGRILGIGIAVFVLASLSDRGLFELIFGLLVGLAVVFSIAGWRLSFSLKNIGAMGIVSGIMGTITSVGAPPMAIVYQDKAVKHARPTLAAFFALGCALSLIGLYLSGWADEADFVIALVMIPGVGAGYLASRWLKGSFDSRYRRYLLAITTIASIILIVRGLQ